MNERKTGETVRKQQTTNQSNKRKNFKQKTHGFGKARPAAQKNETWYKELEKSIQSNKQIQQQRVYPMNFKAPSSNDGVKITPLGGLGEIGGNMMVMETNTSAVIIDVGMSFPNDEMHGVDILVPDFSYLRIFKNNDLKFPIYASPLPLGMIANKFDEHKLMQAKKLFHPIQKRKVYKIGDFEVEWMHITHSIIDASSLAITTKAGTIIHTGDFKIDHTPIDGLPADLHRFAYYGDKGVLCLLRIFTEFIKLYLMV